MEFVKEMLQGKRINILPNRAVPGPSWGGGGGGGGVVVVVVVVVSVSYIWSTLPFVIFFFFSKN